MQRLERDIRRALHADENRVAVARRDLPGKRGTQKRLAVFRARHTGDSMKSPEPLVDSVNTRLRHTTAFVLSRHSALDHQKRCHRGKACLELGLCCEICRQLFAEKTR